MMQVRLITLPWSTCKSGDPWIRTWGTENRKWIHQYDYHYKCINELFIKLYAIIKKFSLDCIMHVASFWCSYNFSSNINIQKRSAVMKFQTFWRIFSFSLPMSYSLYCFTIFFLHIFKKRLIMTNSRKLLHRSSINVNVNAHVLPILFSLLRSLK